MTPVPAPPPTPLTFRERLFMYLMWLGIVTLCLIWWIGLGVVIAAIWWWAS
jgi:hypothetical protein